MYLPRHFEETDVGVLHQFIRAHPFGALVTTTTGGLDANHIPFVLESEPAPYGTLRGHIARANPLWRECAAATPALVLFQGENAFVSPSWYPSKQETGKVVPTWNYVVVHAHGPLRFIDDAAWVRAHVETLTNQHEHERAAPWRVTDAPPDFIERLVQGLVGLEIPIARLVGKWKVSQNRSDRDREGVADGLTAEGTASAATMADLVRRAAERR
jgi:transcriptional regulator